MSLATDYDQLAVEILLDGRLNRRQRDKKLAQLARQARRLTTGYIACPECGDAGPHDDNGCSRMSELSFCCRACGMHFDAEECQNEEE